MFKTTRASWWSLFIPLSILILLIVAVCSVLYLWQADQIAEPALDRENRRMEILASQFSRDINSTIGDLRLLATGDGLEAYIGSGKPVDLERAVRRAIFFSRDNPDYDQLRFINERGDEVLRINQGVVPKDKLQNKAGRYYFQKTSTLAPSEVFVSAIDLNVENNTVERPFKPMVRVATPIFDATGNRRGIYIINYMAGNLIHRLRYFAVHYPHRFRLLNAKGYWLAGAKPEEEWGFMLPDGTGKSLAQTDPELWAKVLQSPSGQVPYQGGYFTWFRTVPRDFDLGKPVNLVADDEFLIFASQITAEEWETSFARLRQTFVVIGTLLVILAVVISWIYRARRLAQQERDRFFSLTRDMLCVANFEGRFVRVNPAWQKSLGYTSEEMIGRPYLDFIHPDDRSKTMSQTANLTSGGEVVSFENRYLCKDGSYRWLLWSARSLVSEQLIYGSARDMTERRQIEERLRLSEERLRQMVENVQDYAIFMLDSAGRVMTWNSGAQRIMGHAAEEIVGKHFSCFYAEDQVLEKHPDRELLEAAEKSRAEDEGWRMRKDGSKFWANTVITAVRSSQSELIGFVKVTRDISERKMAVESLRRSEERNRLIIESAHDGFISINTEGRITDWNTKAESIFGWSKAEVLGRFLHETIIPQRYQDAHVQGLKHLQAAGHGPVLNKTIELSGVRRNTEEFPLELVIWPLQVGTETTYHAFVRDITSRKQAAESIKELNEELKQRADLLEVANKELESFSYSVSHDLRAPLRHIHGFVDLLQKSPVVAEDKSAHRYMGVIAKAAKEMGMLIDDLLAFSRTGRAEMHPVKIKMRDLVDQVIRDLEMDRVNRKINWDIKPLSIAQGDPGLMRLVWANLIGNSIKYTRPREEAKIEIGEVTGADNKSEGQEAIYYIRDNGVGFDMQYAAKLFGVFQRLHRADDFEGTGIGLANVQRIVHRHGGRVWAEGKVDAGATFYFSLPINHA